MSPNKEAIVAPILSLTALPVWVAQLQVSASTCRVLLGALGGADVLNLVVERLERGVHLGVVRPQVSGGLVGPHVPQGIGGFLRLRQTSEGRHVDTRAGRTRRTRGTRVSRGTLRYRDRKIEYLID